MKATIEQVKFSRMSTDEVAGYITRKRFCIDMIALKRANTEEEAIEIAWDAKQTVEAASDAAAQTSGDARVVLLGHSAGGWLVRALCVVEGDDWAKRFQLVRNSKAIKSFAWNLYGREGSAGRVISLAWDMWQDWTSERCPFAAGLK